MWVIPLHPPRPAPREPGVESCGRGCTCPGTSWLLSSLRGNLLQGRLMKSCEDLALSLVLTTAEAGEWLARVEDCGRTLSEISHFYKPHRSGICGEEGEPPSRDNVLGSHDVMSPHGTCLYAAKPENHLQCDKTLSEGFLHTRHSTRHFSCITSSNPHSQLVK